MRATSFLKFPISKDSDVGASHCSANASYLKIQIKQNLEAKIFYPKNKGMKSTSKIESPNLKNLSRYCVENFGVILEYLENANGNRILISRHKKSQQKKRWQV
jgi:hypothetical protein